MHGPRSDASLARRAMEYDLQRPADRCSMALTRRQSIPSTRARLAGGIQASTPPTLRFGEVKKFHPGRVRRKLQQRRNLPELLAFEGK